MDFDVISPDQQKQIFIPSNNLILLWYLPAQTCILQAFDWWDGPLQVRPPLEGAGLLQALLRYCLPLPQLLLQGPNDPQADQWPLTKSKVKKNAWNKLTARIDALINKDENLIFQTEEALYLKNVTDIFVKVIIRWGSKGGGVGRAPTLVYS